MRFRGKWWRWCGLVASVHDAPTKAECCFRSHTCSVSGRERLAGVRAVGDLAARTCRRSRRSHGELDCTDAERLRQRVQLPGNSASCAGVGLRCAGRRDGIGDVHRFGDRAGSCSHAASTAPSGRDDDRGRAATGRSCAMMRPASSWMVGVRRALCAGAAWTQRAVGGDEPAVDACEGGGVDGGGGGGAERPLAVVAAQRPRCSRWFPDLRTICVS